MKMPFPINYPEMVVKKSGGLTASENKLAILGYHTFLSLWSYPNPYKMQSNGKELCDLLIVFDKHIIIFSDKDCAYGNSGDALVDWRRWYKKAIQKSAEQLIGAKNWILHYPDRIAVDARQELLTQKHVLAESENDILAQHLYGVIKGNNASLQEISREYSDVYFEGGLLPELKQSKQYRDWRVKVRTSYFWDDLLQKTFFFVENGMSEFTTIPTIHEQSELFKYMACEDRFHRYCLSEGFLSFLSKANPGDRGTRILFNSSECNHCYLLLLLPREKYMSDTDYRAIRREMLTNYCKIIKSEYPEIFYIIGVAHETSDKDYSSEDFVYFDASEWSDEDQHNAVALKTEYEELHLLSERSMASRTFYSETPKMKGRDRNKPCPCGSGRKFKNCCGIS